MVCTDVFCSVWKSVQHTRNAHSVGGAVLSGDTVDTVNTTSHIRTHNLYVCILCHLSHAGVDQTGEG